MCMKKFFVLMLITLSVSLANAQQSVSKVSVADEDVVYSLYEEEDGSQKEAHFPGGEKSLMKFIAKNYVIPQSAADRNISGSVVVGFVVEKNGEITNVEVVKKVSQELDDEAVRVVMKMPKWNPGTVEGEPVRSYCRLPINIQVR